jgi:hypothetical protein
LAHFSCFISGRCSEQIQSLRSERLLHYWEDRDWCGERDASIARKWRVIAVASLLINDVITAVDVEGIAGYGFRRIMREECDREANILDGDELAGRRLPLRLFQQ